MPLRCSAFGTEANYVRKTLVYSPSSPSSRERKCVGIWLPNCLFNLRIGQVKVSLLSMRLSDVIDFMQSTKRHEFSIPEGIPFFNGNFENLQSLKSSASTLFTEPHTWHNDVLGLGRFRPAGLPTGNRTLGFSSALHLVNWLNYLGEISFPGRRC